MKLIKVLLMFGVVTWAAALSLPDRNLHVVFCDVGQGDAILISRGKTQLLVDGGMPNRKVIDCLAGHMPFWDRTIEMVMATHPENDHIGGLVNVVQRYSVKQFVAVPVGKETEVYKELVSVLGKNKVVVANLYTGDRIRMGGFEFWAIWPTREFVAGVESDEQIVRVDLGVLAVGVLGLATQEEINLNDLSIGGVLRYGEFEVMLTGDADQRILSEQINTSRLVDVDVLKVPHHGSKYGMSQEWLEAIRPELAVISVGKNNYSHPTQEALELLKSVGARVLRTDVDGEVEVVSDGKMWWIKK